MLVQSDTELAEALIDHPQRPHWAEEISQEIRMLRTYNAHLVSALARIAHSDAQSSEDAMRMRNIATAVLHPEKAGIYDDTLPTYRKCSPSS